MNKPPAAALNRSASVWLADDDDSIRFVLERALAQADFQVTAFDSAISVRQALQREAPGVLITDVRFPDGNGLELLQWVQQYHPRLPVIITTAFSDLEQAVAAFQHGAFDYLSKPVDLDDLLTVVNKAVIRETEAMPAEPESRDELIGDSAVMQSVYRTIGRLSHSDISVLITGETGTGKDLVARAIHRHSPRRQQKFVAINTAAIPADLLESELFGHEKGAFTGALNRRQGRFEEAQGGTLFLDEIGDMPLALQTRLLRVLAEGDYYRVGGRDLLRADVRVVAATHQDITEKIRAGSFREDLYHRLNVINIPLPPLRQRQEDIPRLADYFLAQIAREMDLERKRLHPDALERLVKAPWPGNVRQLRNLCQQLSVMAPGEQITIHDLPAEFSLADGSSDAVDQGDWQPPLRYWAQGLLDQGSEQILGQASRRLESTLIQLALERTGGNKQEAAKLLGCSRNTLAKKIKELDYDSD